MALLGPTLRSTLVRAALVIAPKHRSTVATTPARVTSKIMHLPWIIRAWCAKENELEVKVLSGCSLRAQIRGMAAIAGPRVSSQQYLLTSAMTTFRLSWPISEWRSPFRPRAQNKHVSESEQR